MERILIRENDDRARREIATIEEAIIIGNKQLFLIQEFSNIELSDQDVQSLITNDDFIKRIKRNTVAEIKKETSSVKAKKIKRRSDDLINTLQKNIYTLNEEAGKFKRYLSIKDAKLYLSDEVKAKIFEDERNCTDGLPDDL